MNKYALIALNAAVLGKDSKNPKDAWERAAKQVFNSPHSMNKGCPKNAFLGLCEEGLVKGIPSGNYVRSSKNKKYALDAAKILKNNPEYKDNPNELWIKVAGDSIKPNSQMEVVIALYVNGLLDMI